MDNTVIAEVGFDIRPEVISLLTKLANDSQYLNKRQRETFIKNLSLLDKQHDACFGLKNVTDQELRQMISMDEIFWSKSHARNGKLRYE